LTVFSFLLKFKVMKFAVGSIFYVPRGGLLQRQIAGLHLVPSACETLASNALSVSDAVCCASAFPLAAIAKPGREEENGMAGAFMKRAPVKEKRADLCDSMSALNSQLI
jgi:hypothetical protein